MNNIVFVGLDVHKATIAVAVAEGARGGEVRELGNFINRPDHIGKLVARLAKGGRSVSFCYEAGPCGYGLYRQLIDLGHECMVVAPSLIPMKAGDRIKTDRRDALMLAKLHRAGELTPVWIPDDAHEAMRDLIRARSTAVRVLGKARQHLQGFLLRHGRVYPGKRGWTLAYRRWLTTVRFNHAAQQLVLQDYIHAVADASEHSSGSTVCRAGITKAGNALARRALIEGAWTYRMQPRVSRRLHDRIEALPQTVRDIAWKAQVRLCARYRRLAAAGKPKVVVTTAIAREMLGFVWAIARSVTIPATV